MASRSSYIITLCVIAASWWNFTPTARAINIDFDADQHFSTRGGEGGGGNLKGQPAGSTAWSGGVTGSESAILITVNEGASGTDQAACTQPGSRLASASDYVFEPSNSDLGGTFNPASSILYYSFQLKPTALAATYGTIVLRMRLCGSDDRHSALNFGLGNNGSFSFSAGDGKGGGTSPVARTASKGGAVFVPAVDTYFTVCGSVNYANKTFTISVNGVPQEVNGARDIPFASPSPGTTPRLDLENYSADDPLWSSTSIDNISLSLTPNGIATPPQTGTRLARTKPAPGPNLDPGIKVGENLILNPSFENPQATYWWHPSNYGKNDVDIALDKDNPRSGAQSQRITIKHVTGTIAVLQLLSPKLPLRAGMSFQLRF